MKKKIILIFISLLLITLPIITLAATSSELNNKKNEIQSNIDEAKDRQDEIKEDISETKAELDKLNDEIAKKEIEIADITEQVNKLTKEVNDLNNKLGDAEKKYDEQYEILCERIVAQYKRGSVSYLDVLLNSSSLSDFISNYYILEKIATYDTELLEDIEEQRNIIETSKKEVEKKKNEVVEKQTQLKLEETILSNKQTSKNKYISQLSSEEKQLQKDIENYNKEMKKVDNELQELARQAASNANGYVYSGGKLEWPVPVYSRISSYFGYRGSAATGGVGTAYHNGYDIAAPHNSNIIAAESGIVMKVVTGCTHDYPKTFNTRCYCGGGYGNYLMINHGGNLQTLYGHCASINVSVGQTVKRGDVIAHVGSAGWSTGNHLHFSVIANGKYVNPGDYFGS